VRLGYLESSEFEAVFRLASVYCQPSFYEGFGLPILEAFERGLPVVSAKTQALVEVGDDACLYVNPNDPQSISDGLTKVIKDKKLAKQLVEKGSERLRLFSWKKCAKETYEVYKRVVRN
jgi:glycosyltransferase involved in cell wall biosynthesis